MRIRKTLLYVATGVLVGVLALASSATAGDHPPNFTCDSTHLPANGAVYWNFTVSGGGCILNNVSFTVSRNVTVERGNLDLFHNAHVTVAGNLTVDSAAFALSPYISHSPSSLVVGGNVTVTESDFNVQDNDPDLTSPITFRVAGNFTSVHSYNVRLANSGYNFVEGTGPSIVEVDGHTSISRNQYQVEIGAGTFGPIAIQDTSSTDTVEVTANAVNGSVTFTGNTDVANWLSYNQIGGNLDCSGNTPPPSNQGGANVVSGSEAGQCAGL